MKIGLLGFGIVGKALVELITKSCFNSNGAFQIKKIATKNQISKNVLPTYVNEALFTTDAGSIVADPEIDIVVELITDTIAAYQLVKIAIENGKHVVTANRQLVSEHGCRLRALSQKKKLSFCLKELSVAAFPLCTL